MTTGSRKVIITSQIDPTHEGPLSLAVGLAAAPCAVSALVCRCAGERDRRVGLLWWWVDAPGPPRRPSASSAALSMPPKSVPGGPSIARRASYVSNS